MRFISSKVHGVMDYLVGILLVASPWLFGFADGGAEMWIPVILGIGALLYSAMTRYELGLAKVIPFKIHLALDIASGILLAISPWLFGFSELVFLPHLLIGLLEIGTALMTNPSVDESTFHTHGHRTSTTETGAHAFRH